MSRSTCSTAPGGTAGQTVSYVQNVTDVDDPLLERATATGVDWRDLAASQIELFQTDMEALNVLAPDHYVGAVEAIPLIVPAIERLLQRRPGLPGGRRRRRSPTATSTTTSRPPASTPSTPRRRLDPGLRLRTVRRRDAGTLRRTRRRPRPRRERQALDPLLWRVARDGEPSWPGGELGEGRPGWHIECTVIAQEYLPKPFTVQGGGSDLIFPHHEMGAGHAYSLAGVPLARHFAHAGMVGLDGEKMSKSKGNLVLVSRLRADGEEPAAIRLAILAHHYRSGLVLDRRRLRRSQRPAPHVARGPRGRTRQVPPARSSAAAGRALQRPERAAAPSPPWMPGPNALAQAGTEPRPARRRTPPW